MLTAAPTSISGDALGYEGKEMVLLAYKDHFSKEMETIGYVNVGADGAFKIDFDLDHIAYMHLRCDRVQGHLYVQAGAQYRVDFTIPEGNRARTFSAKTSTELIFKELPESDINSKIIALNIDYENFFYANYDILRNIMSGQDLGTVVGADTLVRPKSKQQHLDGLLTGLKAKMDSTVQDSQSEFLTTYRDALLADLDMKGNSTRVDLYDQYFRGKAINIDHPEQCKMVQRFFENQLSFLSKSTNSEKTFDELEASPTFKSIVDLVATDEVIDTQELKEIVSIHLIQEVWNGSRLTKETLSSILRDGQTSGSTEAVRELAGNMLTHLERLRIGSKAFNFNLSDPSNENYSLDQLIDKVILLEFWSAKSASSQREIAMSTTLSKTYSDNIRFVSINMDDDKSGMTDYLLAHPELKQLHLYGGDDRLLGTEYQLFALPAYHLIGTDGQVLDVNLPKPSEGLEAILHKVKQAASSGQKFVPGQRKN